MKDIKVQNKDRLHGQRKKTLLLTAAKLVHLLALVVF